MIDFGRSQLPLVLVRTFGGMAVSTGRDLFVTVTRIRHMSVRSKREQAPEQAWLIMHYEFPSTAG